MTTDELIKALRGTDFSDGCPCELSEMCKGTDCIIIQAADRLKEERDAAWDVFEAITSAYGGKQIFFLQKNGMVYDRYKADYITFEEAINRFCKMIGDDWM